MEQELSWKISQIDEIFVKAFSHVNMSIAGVCQALDEGIRFNSVSSCCLYISLKRKIAA